MADDYSPLSTPARAEVRRIPCTVCGAKAGDMCYGNGPIIDFEHPNRTIAAQRLKFDRWLAAHDAALLAAQGEARTADRETIAAAMREHYLNPKDMSECICGDWLDDDMSPDDWDDHLADAVLAVLIPTNLIRAETLEALRRDLREADQTPWHVLDAIEVRAAEYRNNVERS